jgi:hypothetical protein
MLKIIFSFIFATYALTQNVNECIISAYGREAGQAPNTCRGDTQQREGRCFGSCTAGYTEFEMSCYQSCPNGFRDDGLFCAKPAAYGRGAGYAIWDNDKCNSEHKQGCEQHGLVHYPRCRDGYHAFGCCICSSNCPAGMSDIGISCAKQIYRRTDQGGLQCLQGMNLEGGQCYWPCDGAYNPDGRLCLGKCPAGFEQCGAICLKGKACPNEMREVFTQQKDRLRLYVGQPNYDGGLIDMKEHISTKVKRHCDEI